MQIFPLAKLTDCKRFSRSLMFEQYFALLSTINIAYCYLMLPCYLVNSAKGLAVVLDENWSPKDDCMKMMWGQLPAGSQSKVTNKLRTFVRILTFRKSGTEISTHLKGFQKW